MDDEMSEGMGDEVFVDFMGPSDAETHIPPPMYAVPAAALGILPQWTRVTVGVPGSHWLIEENIVVDGPEPGPDGEVYNLVCLAEWGAVTLRPHEQYDVPEGLARLLPWKAPVSSMWVYRFAPTRIEVDQLQPWHPHLWFDNVRTDLDTPPSPRRARPARELPSLTGHRLHAPGPNGIEVLMAVSEPLDLHGEIVVRLVSLSDYSKARYGIPPTEVRVLPLHQLWAY
ncbi:MAG: hypothetical protein WCG47_09120 [Dermatophilaceae bacterium]